MATGYKRNLVVFLLMATAPSLHAGTLFFSGNLRTDGIGCPVSCSLDSDYA